jgi:SAM-dependent methyltransferase
VLVSTEPLQARAERLAETTWLGGPPRVFEAVGRMGFTVLLEQGLRPSSRVLDVGCGALRLGYWLMRFLDPGGYHGIEPQQDMLRVGLEQIVEPDVVERAQARFSDNQDFDFSVFDTEFDFVVARSIWSHASKPQISAMLSSFARTASPSGIFLTSYKPATLTAVLAERVPPLQAPVASISLAAHRPGLARRWPGLVPFTDYKGKEWVGRDGVSKASGTVRHSFGWVAAEAERHGLAARQLSREVVSHQYWLRVERRS